MATRMNCEHSIGVRQHRPPPWFRKDPVTVNCVNDTWVPPSTLQAPWDAQGRSRAALGDVWRVPQVPSRPPTVGPFAQVVGLIEYRSHVHVTLTLCMAPVAHLLHQHYRLVSTSNSSSNLHLVELGSRSNISAVARRALRTIIMMLTRHSSNATSTATKVRPKPPVPLYADRGLCRRDRHRGLSRTVNTPTHAHRTSYIYHIIL